MTMLQGISDVLTIAEVREILYIGRNKVYELISSGELTAFKVGRSWRVTKSALIIYIDRSEQQGMV